MKIWYKNEESGGATVCSITSVVVIIAGCLLACHQIPAIFANHGERQMLLKMGLQMAVFFLIAFFIWRLGKVSRTRAENCRHWHQYLADHGTKARGEVVDIVEHRNIGDSSSRKYYTFIISFFSHIHQEERQFETTTLNFIPDKDRKYFCNVYELQEETIGKELAGYAGDQYRLPLNSVSMSRDTAKGSEKQTLVIADEFVAAG